MRSSYIDNDFGRLLWCYVVNWRPLTLVELGVLDGYSTFYITKGVEDIRRLYQIQAKLDAWDLFEEYQFKHGDQATVQKFLDNANLTEYVNLRQGDAYQVHTQYEDKSIQFLHVDISNTGDTLRRIMELWDPKLADRAIVCFEGGSIERDNVEWMRKYNCPPIKKELETNALINQKYYYGTYWRFPSMTVLLKKWF